MCMLAVAAFRLEMESLAGAKQIMEDVAIFLPPGAATGQEWAIVYDPTALTTCTMSHSTRC